MLLQVLDLTVSGRPKLGVGEFEQAFLEKDGFAILTTHRLIWVDAAKAPAPGASCCVHLNCVEAVELSATKLWTHTKLRVRVHTDHEGRPAASDRGQTRIEELRLVSRQYGSFAEQAQSAVHQRPWLRSTPAPVPSPASQPLQPGGAPSNPLSGGDPALVQQLGAMGFNHNRASRACQATNNSGVDQALQWLFEHEGDPELDRPLPGSAHAPSQPPPPSFAASTPGIMGILRREQEIAARNDRALDEAFHDLRALMAKAQEMVSLAEKFRGSLAGKAHEAEPGEALDADMQQQLIDIGIASPITRELAGARYHKELSRQLADFLGPRLRNAGGILTLADAYCLFNRARGTELISPEDLLQAVSLFPGIGASMHLRKFDTGVLVVQSDAHDDDEVCARIAELVGGEGLGRAVSATEVAAALSVPLTIAAQHLATAESKAMLCRDDGPEGLRFFRNFFEEVASC